MFRKQSNICDSTDSKMKNIDFVLSGYDLYFGNPMPAKAPTPPIDPGFREPIFKAVYDGSTTSDERYCIPCE